MSTSPSLHGFYMNVLFIYIHCWYTLTVSRYRIYFATQRRIDTTLTTPLCYVLFPCYSLIFLAFSVGRLRPYSVSCQSRIDLSYIFDEYFADVYWRRKTRSLETIVHRGKKSITSNVTTNKPNECSSRKKQNC